MSNVRSSIMMIIVRIVTMNKKVLSKDFNPIVFWNYVGWMIIAGVILIVLKIIKLLVVG